MQEKEKNFVSCILYLHNDARNIREFFHLICNTMQENFSKYEIICVNDCCTDDTIEQIQAFIKEHYKEMYLKWQQLADTGFYGEN